MIFRYKDFDVRVILEQQHIDSMVSYILTAGINETGGILLGQYLDTTTATISKIIGPTSDSKSGRYWFVRGVKGLSTLLSKAWKKNEYYLGEWHYHPNGTITPSSQDLVQIKKIAKSNDYKCPEPIMVIIAGNYQSYNVGVFVTDKKFEKTFALDRIEMEDS